MKAAPKRRSGTRHQEHRADTERQRLHALQPVQPADCHSARAGRRMVEHAVYGHHCAQHADCIAQEIHAKRLVDKLSLLNSPTAEVIRGGEVQTVPVQELVEDDVVELASGSQVSADCVILSGKVEVNESLLTGEAEPVPRRPGERLLSAASSSADDAAPRLSTSARRITPRSSQARRRGCGA